MSNYIDHYDKNATRFELVSKPLSDSIADEFSTSEAYAVGDFVMYEGSLYKCKTAKAAGAWNAANFELYQIEEALKDAVVVDNTLSVEGMAADAKAVGDEISGLKDDLSHVITSQMKTALLNCFSHVAWADEDGQDYYNALYDALYNSDSRIVYEIPHGTDISDWSIDTGQHAFTLDEDFTILIKASWEPSDTGAFIIDSQPSTGSIVGVRMQSSIKDNGANVYFVNQFNGGILNSGAGTGTSDSFPANVSHDVVFVMKNSNKNISIKTYVDAVLKYEDNRTLIDKEGPWPPTYYIGKNQGGAIRPWSGVVDLYRIYNEALTDSEIEAILRLE